MRFVSDHISKYNLKNIPESQINKDYDGKKKLKK